MEIGEHCKLDSCLRLTFLPVNCPYCRDRFCQSHFLPSQHSCKAPGAAEADRTLSETEILKRVQRANERRREVQQHQQGAGSSGNSSGNNVASQEEGHNAGPSKLPCQKAGCKQFSLQLDPVSLGSTKPINVSQRDGTHKSATVIHAAPRCDRCRGFFCMTHRSYMSHSCTAPAPATVGDKRRDEANERKKKAQDVLNKHFPNRNKK